MKTGSSSIKTMRWSEKLGEGGVMLYLCRVIKTTEMKLGKLIGQGQKSKVYQHPTNSDLVIKVSRNANEIETLTAFYERPESWFVKIYQLVIESGTAYAVIDKVQTADWRFTLKNKGINGETNFVESRFNYLNYATEVINGGMTHSDYIASVKSKVVESHLVDQYYQIIRTAYNCGCCLWDTAWNMGIKDGRLMCFDTSIV